ncbi:hypothetical protein HK098_003903 [Nowakowskiella sp. JEL0407]|nr:hypothetical protein HK098_003903 [Nowakowskiella sp. JEL0407]
MIPFEIILHICKFLPAVDEFRLLTILRKTQVRAPLLLKIPQLSVKNACGDGNTELLSYWQEYYHKDLKNGINEVALNFACINGHLNVLQWCLENNLIHQFTFSGDAYFINASRNGHVNVLNWFVINGVRLRASKNCILRAVEKGQVEVLHWWKKAVKEPINAITNMEKYEAVRVATTSGNVESLKAMRQLGLRIKSRYSHYHVEHLAEAASRGYIDVVEWWLHNSCQSWLPEYFGEVAVAASFANQLDVLRRLPPRKWSTENVQCVFTKPDDVKSVEIFEWWMNQPVFLDAWNTYYFMDACSRWNRVDLLDWIVSVSQKNAYITLRWTDKALDESSSHGHIETLNWWVKSGLALKWSNAAMDFASAKAHVDVLDWWIESGLELKRSCRAIDMASCEGSIDSLAWWAKSGLDLKYSTHAVEGAFRKNLVNVLQWWKDSGFSMKFDVQFVDFCVKKNVEECLDALIWWMDNGMDCSIRETNLWSLLLRTREEDEKFREVCRRIANLGLASD